MNRRLKRSRRPRLRGMIWIALSVLVCVAFATGAQQRLLAVVGAVAQARSGEDAQADGIDAFRAELSSRLQEIEQLEAEIARHRSRKPRMQDRKHAATAKVESEIVVLLAEQARLKQMLDRTATFASAEDRFHGRIDHSERLRRLRGVADSLRQELRVRGPGAELSDQERLVPVPSLAGGTGRKPRRITFIECFGGGAMVQPQEHRLPDIPEGAAGRAFLDAARTTGYVLFLVRPNGVRVFDEYRALIDEANGSGRPRIEIGYEPIDADWQLAYPVED